MSFDTDPKDVHQRFLIFFAVSDSLFEVFTAQEADNCLSDGCHDVTNIEAWEERFKRENEK